MSYDTTFQLGDFYVSILTFKFQEAPVMPAALIHDTYKYRAYHEEMLATAKKNLVPILAATSSPIVTDNEYGIVNAVFKQLLVCDVGIIYFKMLSSGYVTMEPTVMIF